MKKESKEEIDIELKYRVLIIYDITDDRHRLKLGIRNDTPDKGTEIHIKYCVNRSVSVD